MTWFVEVGRPTVAAVDKGYSRDKARRYIPPPPPAARRKPFDEDFKRDFPTHVSVYTRNDGYTQHAIFDQRGFMLLSTTALDVLRKLQPDGWEAFPLEVRSTNRAATKLLAADAYWFLNLYTHKDVVDTSRGNVPPQVVHKGTIAEKTVYWLDAEHRGIAVKRDLIEESMMLWLGDGNVLGDVYFVSDRLKEAWCRIGMNPAIFEPCIEV